MDITISHLLELPVFCNVRVLTGDHGMQNVVSDISVLEMPIIEHPYEKNYAYNEFYLTGLYAYNDSKERLPVLFDQLIDEQCCGVCVFDTYFKTLPEEIIQKCKDNNLVLWFISEQVPYSLVLRDVFQEIIRVKDEVYVESTIESLLSPDMYPGEVKKKALYLNQHFYPSHMCLFLNAFNENAYNIIQMMKHQSWFSNHVFLNTFRDGVMIIGSFKDLSVENYQMFKDEVVAYIKESLKHYNIGVSSQSNTLTKLGITMSEAIVANSVCMNIKKQVALYDNLGVYKLLYQMKSDVRLSKFRDDILNPIKLYEADNQIPLLETAIQFVEYDGDIKETAAALYLHENTVRYRMDKIKKILNLEHTRFKYYEELSLAIKADKILKRLPE